MSDTLPSDYTALRYASAPVSTRRAPRVWAGIVLILLQWLVIKVPAWVAPQTMAQFMAMMWGPVLGLVAILVWWLGFSRLAWATRWIGLASFVAGALVAFGFGDPSIRMALIVFTLPLATTVWAVWTLIGSSIGQTVLRAGLVVTLLLTWGVFALLRMDGLDGSIHFAVSWRWSQTAEQRYLASRSDRPGGTATSSRPVSSSTLPATSPTALQLSPGDWPGFRGADRDGRLTGVTIRTDWNQNPPKQLWKNLIGPGWSSFCVVGNRAYTQEQRGESEAVVCYQVDTGSELWAHVDKTRFIEPIAGPGPRATPTFDKGRLYSFGANGKLNCLDPITGAVVWTRDVAADSGSKVPTWGFSASPLVHDGLVTVLTAGKGKGLSAYRAADGAPDWAGGDGWSYASAQVARLGGVEQILYVTENGAAGIEPSSGQMLWQHHFLLKGGANRAVQPTIVGADEFLIGAAFGVGTRRVKVSREGDRWKDQEVWTSRQMKPYYNDLVFHKGNLYGFDGNVFTCVSADDGKPRWRSPVNYGNGQVLLLADQDLLLILSEKGEAALVDASPAAPRELGRFQALEGKTWNHPVVAGGKLLVRNGEQAACYDLK